MAAPLVHADAFRQVHPREYLRKFLRQGVRPDGRALTRVRKTTVVTGTISTAWGSALVRVGQTAVLCGIKAELAEPAVERPRQGYLVPNLQLPPLCSPKFRPGPPSDQAQALSQRLYDVVLGSATGPWLLDLQELCVEEGKSVWVLYADALCLNCDGSVFDAALMAMCAALRNLRLPTATYDADKRLVTVTAERPHALTLGPMPFSLSFSVYDGAVLADPTDQEESVSEATVTVVSDADERLILLSQVGGVALTAQQLDACVIVALTRAKEVTELVTA